MPDDRDRFARTVAALLVELPNDFSAGRVTFHISPDGGVKVEVSEFYRSQIVRTIAVDRDDSRRVE